MMFFNNPRGKVSRRGKKRRGGATAKRRRVVRRKARSSTSGASMAGKRKRAARKHTTRRRRRRSTAKRSVGVQVRRRGTVVYQGNPRRRHRRYRRNPGGRGIVTTIKNGVKDGAVILASEVVTKKAINMVSGFVPLGDGIAKSAVVGLGVPTIVALVARKSLGRYASLAIAASYAEGLRGILMHTPVGGLLSGSEAYDAYAVGGGDYGAYPAIAAPGMGAYPGAGYGEAEQYVQ